VCSSDLAKDIVGKALGGEIVSLDCADIITKDLEGAAAAADPKDDWNCKDESEAWWELDGAGVRVGDGYPLCPRYDAL
jgi:hypothetical protein